LFSKEVLVVLGFPEKGNSYYFTIHASEILGVMTNYIWTVVIWHLIIVEPSTGGRNLYYKPLEVMAVP
jgi:hypothetical protein